MVQERQGLRSTKPKNPRPTREPATLPHVPEKSGEVHFRVEHISDDPGGTGSRGTVPRGTRYWPQRPDRIARRTNNVDSLIIIANRVLHQLRDYSLVHVLFS